MMEKNLATILHLSDLHISACAKDDRDYCDWYNQLASDIADQVHQRSSHEFFLVITGDVTASGEREEFEQAAKFLKNLMRLADLREDRVLIVPGNHDVYWKKRDDSKWREFVNLVVGYQSHEIDFKSESSLRSFNEDKISFLMLDSTNELDYPERELKRLNEQLERVSEQRHKVVAMVHHLNRIQIWRMGNSEDPLNKLLKKWNVNVVLHGHEHLRDLKDSIRNEGYISLGAGPLSPERWRYDCGVPSYHILDFFNEDINIFTRIFVEQVQKWIFGMDLPFWTKRLPQRLIDSTSLRLLPGGEKVFEQKLNKQFRKIFEEMTKFSAHSIDSFYTHLAPCIRSYAPLRESQDDFVLRFIKYFAKQNSLDVLVDALRVFRRDEELDRRVVLICSTASADNFAEVLEKISGGLGFAVRRLKVNEDDDKGDIDHDQVQCVDWDDVDLLLLVLSRPEQETEAGVLVDEFMFLANVAFQKGISVVLSLASKCAIPEQLRDVPVIDLTMEETEQRFYVASVLSKVVLEKYNY